MGLLKTSRYHYNAILIGVFYITVMQSSMLMAASGEPDEFETGVAAFNVGDFTTAKFHMAHYTDHDTKGLRAKAYIFAMQDKKPADLGLAPSPELKAFIIGQSGTDPFFKALSAKLHLMGYHHTSNTRIGLIDLAVLGEVDGDAYALYTFGLYHEGVFTDPPSPANLLKAKLKYEEACITGYKAAIERYTIVYQLLNPEPEGAWEGEGEGASQLGDMPSWNPRSEGEGARSAIGGAGSTSVVSSIISHQGSERFYENRSAASGVSADSEIPQQAAVASTNPLAARLVVVGQARPRQGVSTRASTAAAAGPPITPAGAIVSIPRVPAIAVGYESLYQQLLGRSLEYRPIPTSDVGLIILLFRDVLAPLVGSANPLSGAFDISRCGDAGNHLSINIGYKTAKIPVNAGKMEIWICPKFLVEKELGTTASYLMSMMDQWKSPVGYFWTWGGWDVRSDNYDCLLKEKAPDSDSAKNLSEQWKLTGQHTRQARTNTACMRNFLIK